MIAHPQLVMKHTSVFWMGKKDVGLFVNALHSWGSWLLTHFHLPLKEKSQAKKVSLGAFL